MPFDEPTIIDEDATTAAPDTTPAPSRPEEYILIMPGDTIEGIASKFGSTPDTIINRNNLNPDAILPFQGIFV